MEEWKILTIRIGIGLRHGHRACPRLLLLLLHQPNKLLSSRLYKMITTTHTTIKIITAIKI
jgi:hypothetical protein